MSPEGIALDSANNRVLVIDLSLRSLFAVDLATGNRSVVSDSDTGTGTDFDGPKSIALAGTDNRALVVDADLRALFVVDLSSGNRSIVSGDPENADRGVGPDFWGPNSVVLNGGRALVGDALLDALLEVDLTTGDRRIVSDSRTGTGAAWNSPSFVALDSANNRALVTDFISGALLVVDLSNGDRNIISDANTGSGPCFRILSDRSTGGGGEFEFSEVVWDNNSKRLWALDPRGLVFAVDSTTGDRCIVSESEWGAAPNSQESNRLCWIAKETDHSWRIAFDLLYSRSIWRAAIEPSYPIGTPALARRFPG